jgi:hypothetical protein
MSDIKKHSKIKDFSDKLAYNYFVKTANKFPQYADLNPQQKMLRIKKIKFRVLFFSALYGTLGVLFLYIPQYIFPEIFPLQNFSFFYGLIKFRLSLNDLYYGVFLTALEIWLLAMTDIRSVGRIAAVYGFQKHSASDTKEETKRLLDIGLGKDTKTYAELGINPLQNSSKTGVYLLFILFRIKAILSKFIFRFILKKIFGRLAVRSLLDMAGIPIYAFWNAYASSIVIRKANMRMYAHNLMMSAGDWFYAKYWQNNDFRNLIYDNLEFIALTKKSFYPTDYLFARYFLDLFDIPPVKEHQLSMNYYDKISKLSPEIQRDISKFLLIGFLADGKLGSLEIRGLKNLQQKGIVPYDIELIKQWAKKYEQGYGFDEMLSNE